MRELCNALFVNGDKVKTKCLLFPQTLRIVKWFINMKHTLGIWWTWTCFKIAVFFLKFGIIFSIYLRILYAWNAWLCVRLTQNKLKIWNNIEILMVHLWFWVDLMITERVRETVNKIVCFFFALLFYILGFLEILVTSCYLNTFLFSKFYKTNLIFDFNFCVLFFCFVVYKEFYFRIFIGGWFCWVFLKFLRYAIDAFNAHTLTAQAFTLDFPEVSMRRWTRAHCEGAIFVDVVVIWGVRTGL